MWKISKTPFTQTVGGSLPLLIYAGWGAKAECQIINRRGFSCALLPDSMHFTDVTDLYLRGFDLFGFVDASSSHPSKVKYWMTYLWILLIVSPLDNFLHSADSVQRSLRDGRCSRQITIRLFAVRILAKCMLDSAYGRGVCWLRWPTLEQHFTAHGFCSARHDIYLKRSNYENTCKSSISFQWGTGVWHLRHQCEAPATTTAIFLKIWAADVPLLWAERRGCPNTPSADCFPLSSAHPKDAIVMFPTEL